MRPPKCLPVFHSARVAIVNSGLGFDPPGLNLNLQVHIHEKTDRFTEGHAEVVTVERGGHVGTANLGP